MIKINKIVDEYMCYDIDCDTDSDDSFISSLRNKNNITGITTKNQGVYERFRNLFRACFV